MVCFPRRRSPWAKGTSSRPSLAPFLSSRQHSGTSSSRIYENRTIGLLESTHLKLTQLKQVSPRNSALTHGYLKVTLLQVHQKDTPALAIHSSCLKAWSDGGCLRLNQVLSREFKVKSPPWLPPPPPPAKHVLEGNAFIGQWASNVTRIWHDKLKADMTSALTLPEQD